MNLIVLLCLFVAPLVYATDAEREKRWVDQTVDSIFDGEAVFLDADGHRFLGIYTESESQGTNGMIVLHGTGLHPNWDQVVRPVRIEMTLHGWNTLSIQLPLLDSEASYEDYVSLYPEVPPRMKSATQYLADRGMTNIVVVAHSQGATMAGYYLAYEEHDITAFVTVGMSAQHTQPHVNSAQSLKKIDIPVLDIYGSRDFPAVLATAEDRRLGARHNPDYTQVVIPDAYHFFDEHESELLEALNEWFADKLRN